MNQLSILISYLGNHLNEIITNHKLHSIINFDECTKNEVVEIYKFVLQHNNQTIEFHKNELKNLNDVKPFITWQPVSEQKKYLFPNKKSVSEIPSIVYTYLNYFKTIMSDDDLEIIVKEIYDNPLSDIIISHILLHLNGEKASIIKMSRDPRCSNDDLEYLATEITAIEQKINILEAAEFTEEPVNIKEEVKNIVLFVSPSGNIALEKDLDTIKNNLYNDVTYYQDIIELLEAVKTGNFLNPKKLQDLGNSFEDRNGQCRLTFMLYNNMCIITSLFIKKSTRDVGTYSTLKARVKIFNQVKDKIRPDENSINIINSMIDELKLAIGKKVKND